MKTHWILIALLAGLCAAVPPRAAGADDPHSAVIQREIQREGLEFPDDPPASPALPVPGAAPAPRWRFGRFESVQVNVAPGGSNIPGDAANEPTIAVDPTNHMLMAIAWRQFDNVTSNFRQAGWGYTTDEGRTWTFPGVLTPGVFRSDPVLSYDAEGKFFWNSLTEDFTTDVFKSTNGGAVWGIPVNAYGGDKQWMECDRTQGVGHDNLYSFWTATTDFTRSTNNGGSFRPPSAIPQSPQWGTMAVASDGTLYIGGINGGGNYVFSKSTDAQDPLDPSTSFVTSPIDLGGAISGWDGPNPGGLLGQVWIAVDTSTGPTAGYIYVAGSVDPSGADPLDVKFIRSTDGGAHWSAPVRLNDDPGTSAWQWFGTMSVAPTGRIDVVWNDTRHTGVANRSELHYTRSTDGGVTWSANEQLSPAWNSHVGWPNQNKIGDYYHMDSDRVGSNLAWAATFNNEQDVYYLRIGDYDCNDNGVGDSLDIGQGTSQDGDGNGIPDECEGNISAVAWPGMGPSNMASAPNPFRGSTEIRFDMAASGPARLVIFNAGGQLVRTLLDGEARSGSHMLTWDGTDDRGKPLPAGLYLYRLETREGRRAHRAVLLR